MTADRHARLARTRVYLVASFGSGQAEATLAAAGAAAWVTSPGSDRPVVGAIQVRCKDADTETLRALLERARAMLPGDALLLVNDDLDAVFDADGAPLADGLHLGRSDAAALGAAAGGAAGLSLARERLGPDLLLGTSTRSLAEVEAALAAGVDHAGFGAMAPSGTKSDTQPADPAELERCLAAHPEMPLFPIGGLGPDTLHLVTAAGGRRAAIGAAILHAPDPASAALACLEALDAG